ncbi:MAG: hypothetical protein ABIQ58_04375 [Candidatus Limnocylindrales bacterium]
MPRITAPERRAFVAAAAGPSRGALTNNRFSADIVAVARARETLAGRPDLADLADLAADNALPRWLAEVAGVTVGDLRRRWRLGIDIDGPLDLLLLGGPWASHLETRDRTLAEGRLKAIRIVAADPRAELLVAGRTSATTLGWLERSTAARTRVLVEERGLRTSVGGQRAPASVLGLLLERDGPGSLGTHLARLADAALIDSRVLLAHRLGADETAWPSAEDRFAADLLLAERVVDPWLRELTTAAIDSPIPVVLGGHTLVGPGLRLAVRPVRPRRTVRPRRRDRT